jgi:hypothetical protein
MIYRGEKYAHMFHITELFKIDCYHFIEQDLICLSSEFTRDLFFNHLLFIDLNL